MHPPRSPSLAVALAALAAACASAPTAGPSRTSGELPRTHTPRPTTGAITPADLMTRLYLIADDSLQGREMGTVGNAKATEYIAAEFRRLGLAPAGEGGTYFQTVPARMWRPDTTRTLALGSAPLVLGTDVLPYLNALAGDALPQGTSLRSVDGAQAVYGGRMGGGALVAPQQTVGRLVVFTVAPGANGERDWRFYMRDTLTRYADAAGFAIAVLDVLPAAIATRYRGTQMRMPVAGAAASAPLTLLVTPNAAARLMGVGSLDGLAAGTPGRRVTGSPVFTSTPLPHPARNVVAVLRGSDPARRGQYVAVGAHNDHVGLEARPLDHDSVEAFNRVVRRQGVQDPVRVPSPTEQAEIDRLRDSLRQAHGGVRPDSINNGADDDGSGTVALLEIAERFATASTKPRRSILFVSHTGEEKGLLGSQWFTDHPTVPRDSIVAQLNMDMVGRGKPTDARGRGPNNVQLIGPRRLSTQLGDVIDSLNARRTPRMDLDLTFDANGHPLNRYCRSDHYMYARYGIPITYFSLGYHTGYHQVIDEPQYIDYEHMQRIAQFVHDIARAVADRPARLVVDKPRPDPRGGCRQ
jgi:hypothetical protein